MTTPARIATIIFCLFIAACGGDSSTGPQPGNIVNVYNWSEAVDLSTIAKFEAETGIEVNYDTYAASATVDVKLLTGNSGYDVIFHANAMSDRLVKVGVFKKLDMSLLPNAANLDPVTMARIDHYEGIRGYYMPYTWGSTGFSWNEEMVRERLPDQPMDTAAVLFEPELISKLADCGVSFLDGTTSLIPMALSYLGLDPNATDEESLERVQNMLARVRPYVRYFSNEKYLIDMPNEELCVAMNWSGDYATATRRAREVGLDIDLRYNVPKEGASFWVDSMYIASDARNVENAHKFINFMLRGDIAAMNAIRTDYAVANAAAWEYISEDTLSDPAIYPDEEIWRRLFAVEMADPATERMRSRTLARAKSGL